MASPDVMSTLLQSLTPRPPTPPREAAPRADSQTNHLAVCQPSGTRINIQTPPGIYSSDSSSDSSSDAVHSDSSSSRRIAKRVGFSTHTEYKDPPVYADGSERTGYPTPASLPSSSSKPVKSILKVSISPRTTLVRSSSSSSPASFDPTSPNASLGAMLDSAVQQLAGADLESRLDAYIVLAQALKASDSLPDRVALQEKMGLFMQFIQRDVTAKAPVGATDVSSLVVRALNLLVAFFSSPAIASTLTNDFATFLIDHCIRSFEDPSTPKDVVRRLMQVIVCQNFGSRVMTSDRVGRLVASLHDIEERFRGKGITVGRIMAYRKLVQQCKQAMVVHSAWLVDLFAEMLSGLLDVRNAAIGLGLDVAFGIGREKSLSRKAAEIVSPEETDENTHTPYHVRLEDMTRERPGSATVPQIWSVAVLVSRSATANWHGEFSPWLHVIQTCFNSSDVQTRIEANRAWSRLVYLFHSEGRVFSQRISSLRQPFAMQLQRKGYNKQAEELRRAVLGGICNLLYYAFRPSTSLTLVDDYWDGCLRPLIQLLDQKANEHLAESSTKSLAAARAPVCAILTGLLDSTTKRPWSDSHVVESPLVRPEELPAIDAKWVRHNAARAFRLVEPILAREFVSLSDAGSPVRRLWEALVGAVASAASKEIKVSIDTANFVAHALTGLQNIWRRGPTTAESAALFFQGVRAYLDVMTGSLGLLPFTEKLLSTDAHDRFVTVSTPTHRSGGRSQGTTKAPVYHVFSMLSLLPPHVADNDEFAAFVGSVFAPFFAAKSEKGQADLAQDLLSTIPVETAAIPYGSWLLVSRHLAAGLDGGPASVQTTSSSNTSRSESTPVGLEYRGFARVLERGLRACPNLPPRDWRSLLSSVCAHCRQEAGDAGVAIGIIEPLAKLLLGLWTTDGNETTKRLGTAALAGRSTDVLYHATQPRDRQAVDAARRRLWGTVISGGRSISYDTFDHLYKLLNVALGQLYEAPDPQAVQGLSLDLLRQVGHFFDRCNSHLVAKTLVSLQDGLVPWIKDNQADSRRQPSEVVDMVKSLWHKVATILVNSEWVRDLQLASLERLLCAAFESKHRQIVNATVSAWNSGFDQAEQLEYPPQLKSVLLSLKPFADIALPGLDTSSVESGGREPFFVDSQDDVASVHLTPAKTTGSRPSSRPPSSVKLSALARDNDSTPRPRSASSSGSRRRSGTTPRPRHDDSQVQFAAIESSPLLGDRHFDSQLLTERQKEVRQRQREDASLFSDMRSSPSAAKTTTTPPPQNKRATTPDPKTSLEKFVASTPTPRRGRPLSMPYHDSDPADPPSSPPEPPRGNPLLAEIQSRTANHNNSLMTEWTFSSSPISGSPNPGHQASGPREPTLPDEHETPDEADHWRDEDDVMVEAEPELPASSPVEDAMEDNVPLPSVPLPLPDVRRQTTREIPATPQRYLEAVPPGETPRSDNDIYQDAQSSPLSSRSRRSRASVRNNHNSSRPSSSGLSARQDKPATEPSFDASELDERSMLRLVVELDSGRLAGSDYQPLAADSPEKHHEQEPAPADEALDCIVVAPSPSAKASPEPAAVGTGRPSTPASHPGGSVSGRPGSSGRKRGRRGSSRSAGGSSRKRRRREPEPELEPVPEPEDDAKLATPQAFAGTKREGMELRNGRVAKRKRGATGRPVSHGDVDDEDGEIIPSSSADAAPASQQEPEDNEVQWQLAAETAAAQNVRAEENAMQIDDTGPSSSSGSTWQKLRSVFQSGLDVLKTARLSRDEVYEAEDMLMDMKRQLYEAERRGRGPRP